MNGHISNRNKSLKLWKIRSSKISSWSHWSVTETMTANSATDYSALNSSKMRMEWAKARWNYRPVSSSTHLGSWMSSREEGSQYTKLTVDIHSQAHSQVSLFLNLKKSVRRFRRLELWKCVRTAREMLNTGSVLKVLVCQFVYLTYVRPKASQAIFLGLQFLVNIELMIG